MSGLAKISSIVEQLDVKVITDQGAGSIADGTGSSATLPTTVYFTKSFVDIRSIQVTPKAVAARIAIYDFLDAPNPSSFDVYIYDAAGVQVACDFSWTARGI